MLWCAAAAPRKQTPFWTCVFFFCQPCTSTPGFFFLAVKKQIAMSLLLLLLTTTLLEITNACSTDEDCSLNGLCTAQSQCVCDKGWVGEDCGVLNLAPATRHTGYNLTGSSPPTSSWGGKIIPDPKDSTLHHLFAAEFTGHCGLDFWSPMSRIIRAESRSGPAGPYTFAQEIAPTFAHNPTVVYSEAEGQYLMYHIG